MEITILVAPVPKGRPRTRFLKNPIKTGKHKGQHVMTYTPEKTQNAENEIIVFIRGMHLEEYYPAGIPLRIEAIFYRSRPKGKKDDLPTQKPDWDNFAKLLLDALEGELYENDSQITTAIIRKRYIAGNTEPRIYLKLIEDSIADDF